MNIIGSLQAWQLFLVLIGYRSGTQVLGYLIHATGFEAGSLTQKFPAGLCCRRFDCLVHPSCSSSVWWFRTYLWRRREERILA
ncbi:MAG: hypothetical protein KIS63_02715 [Caldilineales bacterium]|nr:hypothetical protein [Caldilineales bacterium]